MLPIRRGTDSKIQTIDQFWIEHEKFWSRTGSFPTLYIWKSSATKYGKSYLCYNLYVNPFIKVMGLVGCQLTSIILGIVTSEIYWKYYNNIQHGQSSCLQSDSSKKQAILYGASKMYKSSIMGTRCVYNWTGMMVDMGLHNLVHNC